MYKHTLDVHQPPKAKHVIREHRRPVTVTFWLCRNMPTQGPHEHVYKLSWFMIFSVPLLGQSHKLLPNWNVEFGITQTRVPGPCSYFDILPQNKLSPFEVKAVSLLVLVINTRDQKTLIAPGLYPLSVAEAAAMAAPSQGYSRALCCTCSSFSMYVFLPQGPILLSAPLPPQFYRSLRPSSGVARTNT